MSKNIKVIEGLEPWEVMKRASEGEAVALWLAASKQWVDASLCGCLKWDDKVAIIDTTTPEIDFDEFYWDFFGLYGGVLLAKDGVQIDTETLWSNTDNITILESPFYYWPGGEQPVPDNVEVEFVWFNVGNYHGAATRSITIGSFKDIDEDQIPYLIAFKLTGRVL